MVEITLSPRDCTVVDCLLEGMSNKVAARALGISIKTIETHVNNVLHRVELQSRTEFISRVFKGEIRMIRVTPMKGIILDSGTEDEESFYKALTGLYGTDTPSGGPGVFVLGPELLPILEGMALAGIESARGVSRIIRETGAVRVIIEPKKRNEGEDGNGNGNGSTEKKDPVGSVDTRGTGGPASPVPRGT